MSNGHVYRPRREKVEAVRNALISWFEENGRDLPWRRTRDPYRVLVSEVMLQQIQVVRAIPFYERFLERFPTVEALANAPISDAIRVWGDLGRYRRVANLHRTARTIVDDHGGESSRTRRSSRSSQASAPARRAPSPASPSRRA